MNFTQEQISDLLFDLANEKGGTHLLLNLTLDAFMKAERSLHQKETLVNMPMAIGTVKQLLNLKS